MNEQICATALYYIDSENINPSSISFRMKTSSRIGDRYRTVTYNTCTWLERTHGSNLGDNIASSLQIYGTVQTHEGRLLAFPNVL